MGYSMNIPTVDCKIDIYCPIFPSEDPIKVKQTVTNIFEGITIEQSTESLKAKSNDMAILEKIQNVIRSRKSQKTYRRILNKNLIDNTTWFYLNKQAAFAGAVALCDEAQESPLGPIKVVIQSKQIESIIDWLIS